MDQKLPLPRHGICLLQKLYTVDRSIVGVRMWTEEVVVSDPECKAVRSTLVIIKTAFDAVGFFERAVQPFYDLFVWTVFSGDRILIGQTDDLGDGEAELFPVFVKELLGSQRVCAVPVGDKFKVFWKPVPEIFESHPHGEDARADGTVIGYLIAKDGTPGRIKDKPDIAFDAAYLDIGFIGSQMGRRPVIIVIGKRFDHDSSRFGVVGDLLMREGNAIKVFQGTGGLAEGKPEIDMEGKAEPHDVGVKLFKFQRRRVLREGVKIHPEEIDGKFPVEVVEFVL